MEMFFALTVMTYFEKRIVQVIKKNSKKIEAKCWEFANILMSLKQFIRTVKDQDIFWNRTLFLVVSGDTDQLCSNFYLNKQVTKKIVVLLLQWWVRLKQSLSRITFQGKKKKQVW